MDGDRERIVVGVDGSVPSVFALRFALREAAATGAQVEAVLVWQDPWAISGPPSLFGAGRSGIQRLEQVLAEAVEHAVDEEGGTTVPVTQRVVPGHPAEVLVEAGEGAKMLVVGTTGLVGFKRWMLGSVSQHCAELSRIPVVIVPVRD